MEPRIADNAVQAHPSRCGEEESPSRICGTPTDYGSWLGFVLTPASSFRRVARPGSVPLQFGCSALSIGTCP